MFTYLEIYQKKNIYKIIFFSPWGALTGHIFKHN